MSNFLPYLGPLKFPRPQYLAPLIFPLWYSASSILKNHSLISIYFMHYPGIAIISNNHCKNDHIKTSKTVIFREYWSLWHTKPFVELDCLAIKPKQATMPSPKPTVVKPMCPRRRQMQTATVDWSRLGVYRLQADLTKLTTLRQGKWATDTEQQYKDTPLFFFISNILF